MMHDKRLTPAKGDVAAAALRGKVEAERFVEPVVMEVAVSNAPLTFTPDGRAKMETELLFGERFDVYERSEGWAWGQSRRDGYVGYVPDAMLTQAGEAPTHVVRALGAHLYTAPDMKSRPEGMLPAGAQVRVSGMTGRFAEIDGIAYISAAHLAPIAAMVPDWVAEAERYLGVPYLWGGRSPSGIDCSGLVQTALMAAGRDCPRDSDMQEAGLGRPLEARERMRRGDLVFWKGHVGIMLSATKLLHATAHYMAVVIEPYGAARKRIAAAGDGLPTRRVRLDG